MLILVHLTAITKKKLLDLPLKHKLIQKIESGDLGGLINKRLPVVSVDGQNYTNANILLGADGRWSLLSITPPSTSVSITETCTTANVNLTNLKRITKGMDLAQVTGIFGCKPDKSVSRDNNTTNFYTWSVLSSTGLTSIATIQVWFDTNDRNASLCNSFDL